ncbi:MAG: hypothetical protein ACM3L6_03475 [Deltaproteobacteria bacterium]
MSALILAAGADLKNRFLIAEGRRLLAGPALGDLGAPGPFLRYRRGIRARLGRRRPAVVACDLHPGYFSTRFARESWEGVARFVGVQHHHAHIASVLFEHALTGPVIGVSFDGTGYGTDGRVWGGEFLLAAGRGFRRLAHLAYLRMPGAERVVREPWRMALSVLGRSAVPFLKKVKKEDLRCVLEMLDSAVPMPLTSSAGRLFDAAAALMGVCPYASFEAEGPIALEGLCASGVEGSYGHRVGRAEGSLVVDARPVFDGMRRDLKKKVAAGVIASRFHNAMADIVVQTVRRLSRETGLRRVALSGGVFQNRYLALRARQGLEGYGVRVFTNERLPVNDGNIAWGQYYVSGRAR